MNFQDILYSRAAIAAALGISSAVPPRIGYPLAYWIADQFSNRPHIPTVRAVRSNQWVIHQQKISVPELDEKVRKVFRSSGRSLYDFYHYLKRPDVAASMVAFDPSFLACFERARHAEKGTLLVGPHMSNFDLIVRAIALRGLPVHILTYPQPPGGYRWHNQLRLLPGLTVAPMSPEALTQASKILRAGGTVITGIDRPLQVEDAKYKPRFFGMTAAMPVFHIRLALKHHIPITVLGGRRQTDGSYLVWASDPIEMQHRPDLIEEVVENAENALQVIASFICQAPDQWAMFYPVWPQTMASMPHKDRQ